MNFPGARQAHARPMTDILKATDRCVMCGMCLPHCPTYGETRLEGDSPRGRISLMHALNTGALPSSDSLVGHLEGCLTCRACEAVCPAAVPYGALIDAARATLRQQRSKRFDPVRTLAGIFIERRRPRRLAGWLLRAYQRSGVQKIARTSGILKLTGLERADSLLPPLAPLANMQTGQAVGRNDPTVGLFTGCVAEIFDRVTLAASQRMLTRLGYNVRIPSRQTCCGALYQHEGAPDKAVRLAEQNVDAFDQANVEAVISTASGCGAQLAEYPRYLQGEPAQRFSNRHQDICQFLAEQQWPRPIRFKPLAAKVAVHTPCSLAHVLKQAEHPLALLARIPGIELFELPDNARCCGAAGSYMLRQVQMADELLADKIQYLRVQRPDILVTSNVGCALHFGAGLRRASLGTEVMHPVTLLEKQLADG
jgi:glycolate oxidase iron-sulfur subunit